MEFQLEEIHFPLMEELFCFEERLVEEYQNGILFVIGMHSHSKKFVMGSFISKKMIF